MPAPTSRQVTQRGASSAMLVPPAVPESKPATPPLQPPLPAPSVGTPAAAVIACQLEDFSSQVVCESTWQEDDSASLDDQHYVTRQLEEVAARLLAVAPRARAQSLLPGRTSIDTSPGDEVSGKGCVYCTRQLLVVLFDLHQQGSDV